MLLVVSLSAVIVMMLVLFRRIIIVKHYLQDIEWQIDDISLSKALEVVGERNPLIRQRTTMENMWRYDMLCKASEFEMICRFWKSLDSFYPDLSFLDPKATFPEGYVLQNKDIGNTDMLSLALAKEMNRKS